MSTKTFRKLAVFCLTSAALSTGAAMTANSAIAGPIYTWDLQSTFDIYWYPFNTNDFTGIHTNAFDYHLVIDGASYIADNPANLFNSSLGGNQFYIGMTYLDVKDVKGDHGFISHNDIAFSEIGTNKFSAFWNADADNNFFSPLNNIASMKLEIERTASNQFDLKLFGLTTNNETKLFASDQKVSFQERGSTPEPNTVLGLLGLAAFTFKALKKNPKNSGTEG